MYLNLVVQCFVYDLVVAVCFKATGSKKLAVISWMLLLSIMHDSIFFSSLSSQIVQRFDQRLFVTPSRRRMDVKVTLK